MPTPGIDTSADVQAGRQACEQDVDWSALADVQAARQAEHEHGAAFEDVDADPRGWVS